MIHFGRLTTTWTAWNFFVTKAYICWRFFDASGSVPSATSSSSWFARWSVISRSTTARIDTSAYLSGSIDQKLYFAEAQPHSLTLFDYFHADKIASVKISAVIELERAQQSSPDIVINRCRRKPEAGCNLLGGKQAVFAHGSDCLLSNNLLAHGAA